MTFAGVFWKSSHNPHDHAVAQELADVTVVVVVHVTHRKGGRDIVVVAPQGQSEVAKLAVGHELAVLAEGRLCLQAGAGEVRGTDSERRWLHMLKLAHQSEGPGLSAGQHREVGGMLSRSQWPGRHLLASAEGRAVQKHRAQVSVNRQSGGLNLGAPTWTSTLPLRYPRMRSLLQSS